MANKRDQVGSRRKKINRLVRLGCIRLDQVRPTPNRPGIKSRPDAIRLG